MKTLSGCSLGVVGVLALTGAAYGQVPGTNDTSDASSNTGSGSGALGGRYTALTGALNTAFGAYALSYIQSGRGNTAAGAYALMLATTGIYNTGIGYEALYGNQTNAGATGSLNTAVGTATLFSFSAGSDNAGLGYETLFSTTSGNDNSGLGYFALYNNTTGNNNTAVGYQALYGSTTANYTTGIGYDALYNSQSGLANIGVGPLAGKNIVQGELNIDIGSWGSADESNTIRIGISPYHTHTYIAGIYSTTGLSGLPVIVTSTGQLGVAPVSSERFKTGIATMGPITDKLSRLRPVTFKLKTDAKGTTQYGLIAEEVAKVYPELVIRDEKGRIDGVRYDELAPMLLNELQKQDAKIASLELQMADMHAALATLQPKDPFVSQR
jgi:hypothetical protein